jgi:muramoyltetrapeptide carboxypeptidase
MLLPTPLKKGDKLIAIAPSGTLRDEKILQQGLKIWQNRGYQVILEENYLARQGYLAGNDQIRRQALAKAWNNPEYKGILCIRGGYGGARLLEDWQWQKISSPKWLIGFSDITALLWSLYQENIIGIHGAVLTTISSEPEWSLNRLFNYLEGQPLPPLQGQGWGRGKATGRLLAGNLTVATHLLGTASCPDLEGVILALEDVGEAPYRIDRMLTQWRSQNLFTKIKGILLGRFSSCDLSEDIPSFTTPELLRDRLEDLNIPIISDLPFGHEGVNACLPVGSLVQIDADQGKVDFLP